VLAAEKRAAVASFSETNRITHDDRREQYG